MRGHTPRWQGVDTRVSQCVVSAGHQAHSHTTSHLVEWAGRRGRRDACGLRPFDRIATPRLARKCGMRACVRAVRACGHTVLPLANLVKVSPSISSML